jgi:hypothetical protein
LRPKQSQNKIFFVTLTMSKPNQTAVVMNTPYRAALSLNNQGVTMMECSCYGQALKTFMDAIRAHKEVGNDFELVNHMIDNATRRTFCPEPFYSERFPFQVLSHDAADFTAQDTLLKTFTLIRFEASDIELLQAESEDSQDISLVSILCNAALASLSISRRQDSAAEFLRGARMLLKAMYPEAREDLFVLKRVIFLSCIALATVVAIEQSCGQTAATQANMRSFHNLSKSAGILEQSVLFKAQVALPAPVA